MTDRHTVQTCRWAEPTLFAMNPYWLAAEEFPWCCHADGRVRTLEDTQICETCARWVASQTARPEPGQALIRRPEHALQRFST